MVNKTAMNISNASSEWVVVKVNPSIGEATKQVVKPGESKKFYSNHGQFQFQLHLINSTRVENHKGEYEQNFCSYNNYIIKNGARGLELVPARPGTLWQ